MNKNLLFGDIVVVEDNLIGVIVKSWMSNGGATHEVYVRSYRSIQEYSEDHIERYRVRHKELAGDELQYQNNNL